MEDIRYANAFYEVLEILSYISKEDYEKIPRSLIELFEENANLNYNFKYNSKITLREQGCSDITKAIIALLYRDYWASKEEKENILLNEKNDKIRIEQEKQEKYNPDNLFNARNKGTEEITLNIDCKKLIEYKKENFLRKLLRKIRNFF